MKNKKALITMTIIILTILLIGAVALIVLLKFTGEESKEGPIEPTIDEIIEYSVDVPEITTNLLDGEFVRIQFKIQTDSVKAKEELAKRDFQMNNIIIQELSEMTSDQFKGKDGILNLENMIKDQANGLMQEGQIIRVYTTSFVLQ
ncbi:flagellar FliL protein [Bacillus mesophilus]|uniref:Flagellar protein FliL n=1 Tax=Bacillus mesophilus TaxID=1808955 RepID=A0A6M0Q1S5_9BACI|nr:flagellar basal body-associated protein FliL [Bacillus mesophilus]MBM7659355.1 flagellar FliL protein [Bacillus mesophilus]NEY70227.1 flagellar basal body-associated protein FliL [Bacillus mesophilus]